MGYFSLFKRQLVRELLLHSRQLSQLINTCLFFLMVLLFFPLTWSPDQLLLRTIAPGLVWIAMLLALLLSADRLFQQEDDDGVLEQWLVSGYPVSLFIAAKLLVHWLLTLLPMLFFCPFLALFFSLNAYEVSMLMLSLACGSPAIISLCGLSAAFGVGLQQKGVLMALILLPLTIPVMVFGSATLTAAMQGLPVMGYLALLLAISVITLGLLPFAIAGVVRACFSS